jgi:hypothetical protein
MGDLFEPVLKLKQTLPQLAGAVAGSEKEEGEDISIAVQAETQPGRKAHTKKKGKSAAGKRRKL